VVRAIAHDQRHKPASQRQLDDALTNVVWNAVLDWLGMLVVQGFRPRPSQPVWSLRMADDRVIQIASVSWDPRVSRRSLFASPERRGLPRFSVEGTVRCFTLK
jgi:hypothetical protein